MNKIEQAIHIKLARYCAPQEFSSLMEHVDALYADIALREESAGL